MQLTTSLPQGFSTFIANLGIRDQSEDFLFVKSDVASVADGDYCYIEECKRS